MTLLSVLGVPLLLALGAWQLERGSQKRSMENEYLAQLTRLPVAISELDELQHFARVALRGRYDEKVFLVDNQVSDGVVGYWVVQVFDEVGGQRFLTNRGFIAALDRRDRLPLIRTSPQTVKVVGVVWPFMGLLPEWGQSEWATGWPKRVQSLDIARMAALVGAVPIEVRLEAGQPGVEAPAPFVVGLNDDKHMGYAATWFGLAVVLAVGFVAVGLTSARSRND
jgi:cytochrome oxidase assembly protein ShyY1